jgi:hypothetical protein
LPKKAKSFFQFFLIFLKKNQKSKLQLLTNHENKQNINLKQQAKKNVSTIKQQQQW